MSGQIPTGDVRLTANIKAEIHQKLKIASVITRTTMGDLIEQLITEKLNDILRKGVKQ